jgi:hypothetical protein
VIGATTPSCRPQSPPLARGPAARPDKWYLSGGTGLIWAPPFPLWLSTPGFWDEAHLFQYAVRPVFTVAFVAAGTVVTPRSRVRRWTPAALELEHGIGPCRATETRAVWQNQLVSQWALHNPTRRSLALDIVAWTAVDGAALVAGDVHAAAGGLRFTREVADRHEQRARIVSHFALTPRARSYAGYRSEASGAVLPPHFDLSPFWDRWQPSGALRDELHLDGLDDAGLVFLGLQRRLRLTAGGRASFTVTATFHLGGTAPRPAPAIHRRRSPIRESRASWDRYFAGLPDFRCSDPFLDHHWRYRWYGLRLNGIAAAAAPQYRHPSVCEGIGYFHVPISYSAPGHMRELRWHPDPEWARGVFRTFFDRLRPDGGMHGRVYPDHLVGTDFYHGDWGGAVVALDQAHPDAAFRHEAYAGLSRYAAWLTRTRDPEASGLVDVVDQYETGQEYMSRYQAVDPDADRYGWENRIRLKGVDVTVYAYRLFRALEDLARTAPVGAVAEWTARAEGTRAAVRDRMWDADRELFSDVDPRAGRRTGVKAAVCFYPYATDLAGAAHAAGLGRHLFDPREFWTPYPVPSSSRDDPRFDPDAEWHGKRHNCPWNGRVWPMANSHVVDALAQVVRAHRPDWAPRLGALLRRFVRMMTTAGRADLPNAFEHYHPFTGRPSRYRGIDDYQHSWINDLIVTHVIGVLPHGETGCTVHPLRLGFAAARLRGLRLAGHRLDVRVDAGRYTISLDGRAAGRGRVGEPVSVAF